MTILEGLSGLRSLPAGAVVSVGNYDGVHRGHQKLLEVGRQLRSAEAAPTRSPLVVVTFEPHPLTVLRPEKAPPRLTPPALKQSILASLGVDILVNLPPSPEVLNLAAETFWLILRDEVRPSYLVEGSTFAFGKGRGGTAQKLAEWARGSAVAVYVVESVSVALTDLWAVPVGSSLIRWLLACGRVRDAATCLGRPYTLEGPVVEGYRRGRTIGVPTANLLCEQMVPLDGVYAGRCEVDGRIWPAAVSIGAMPTFGENRRQVEAHLIGFDGDLYGRTLRLELIDWLRDQWKFPSVTDLLARMKRDMADAVRLAGSDPAREVARV